MYLLTPDGNEYKVSDLKDAAKALEDYRSTYEGELLEFVRGEKKQLIGHEHESAVLHKDGYNSALSAVEAKIRELGK